MTGIEFEITHRCDKACVGCDHRIQSSTHEMTLTDYDYVLKRVGDRSTFKNVLLIGGEPTQHPELSEITRRVRADFVAARVTIQTNGRGMAQYFDRGPFRGVRWVISEYPAWNDAVVERYRDEPGVEVYRFGGKFWDITVDPRLSEVESREVRQRCLRVCRVIGRKLYDCCLSEGIEREFGTEPVHVAFTENWREEIDTIQTWRACAHCFRASYLLNGTMWAERTLNHDD